MSLHLLVAHLGGAQDHTQEYVYIFAPLEHVPPLWHGDEAQLSITVKYQTYTI